MALVQPAAAAASGETPPPDRHHGVGGLYIANAAGQRKLTERTRQLHETEEKDAL